MTEFRNKILYCDYNIMSQDFQINKDKLEREGVWKNGRLSVAGTHTKARIASRPLFSKAVDMDQHLKWTL